MNDGRNQNDARAAEVVGVPTIDALSDREAALWWLLLMLSAGKLSDETPQADEATREQAR